MNVNIKDPGQNCVQLPDGMGFFDNQILVGLITLQSKALKSNTQALTNLEKGYRGIAPPMERHLDPILPPDERLDHVCTASHPSAVEGMSKWRGKS